MVNKLSTIKERFKQVADKKGISYSKLYDIIEMTDGNFKGSAKQRPINSDAIEKLFTHFQDINLEWLITGKAKTALEQENNLVEEPTEPYMKDYKDKYIEVLEENRELNKEIRALQKRIDSQKKSDQQIFTKP